MCPHCLLVVLLTLFPFLGSLLLWWRGVFKHQHKECCKECKDDASEERHQVLE